MRALINAVLSLGAFMLLSTASIAASAPRIAIVYRSDIPLHEKLVQRMEYGIKERLNHVEIKTFYLLPGHSGESRGDFVRYAPQLVIALGDTSLAFSLGNASAGKGIFLLVADRGLAGKAVATKRWSGTCLWLSPEKQLELIRGLFPAIKSIGTVISRESSKSAAEFTGYAKKAGIELHVVEAVSSRDVIPAVVKAFRTSDAFWMIPDPLVANSVIFREMLRLQHDYRKPVIGLSRQMVELGSMISASYALPKLLEQVIKAVEQFERVHTLPDPQTFAVCCYTISLNPRVASLLSYEPPAGIRLHVELVGQGPRI